MMNKTSKRRKPGRPSGTAKGKTRDHLLDVASRHVAQNGLQQLTIKALAENADVNTALAHYYFGNKKGLQEAVIDHLIDQLTQNLRKPEKGSSSTGGDGKAAIKNYTMRHLQSPFAARFALENLLLNESTSSTRFLTEYVEPGLKLSKSLHQKTKKPTKSRENDYLFRHLTMVGATLFYSIFLSAAENTLDVPKDTPELQEQFSSFLAELIIDKQT